MSPIPYILFDTDMDTDCDDVGALSMLLHAHLQGVCRLVGIVTDSLSRHAAPCCEVLCRHYGVQVPIGAVYADDFGDTAADLARFAPYRAHSAACMAHGYNHVLAAPLSKVDRDYPAAVRLYRQVLSQAADGSITVLCVGLLTALDGLLASPADDLSPLNGVEMVRRKVARMVVMGDLDRVGEFNFKMDAPATARFFARCPVPVYISAAGADVITGAHLSTALPFDHPLRRAYALWLQKEHCGRASWDLIASLYALHPGTPYLPATPRGRMGYDEKALCGIPLPGGDPLHYSIAPACDSATLQTLLNEYMLGQIPTQAIH